MPRFQLRCHGPGVLEEEGGWCLYVQCLDCGCHTAELSFRSEEERYVGVLFAGWERETGPQVIYVASNAYWEELQVELPQIPKTRRNQ